MTKDVEKAYISRRPTQIDGGYGWLVVIASFLGHMFQYGVVWSVGVFYVLFLENIGGEKGAVALISSLNTATFYVTGPLSAMLTNKYGCRPVSMVGGFIGSLGLVLSVFANNIYFLYATFGVLTGFGLGLSFIPTVSIVGFYFDKYRSIAVGIAVSGVGIGTFAFPPLIRLLVHGFGYKGAILITGAVCLNLLVCGALFRPVETQESIDKKREHSLQINKEKEVKVEAPKSTKETIFHLNVFRNLTYVLLSINNVLVTFGMSVIYVHFPAYATSLGFSDDAGAMLISVIGISNFLGRLLLGLLAIIPRLRVIYLYTTCWLLTGLATVLCPLVKSYIGLMVFSGVFGITTAALGTLLPILIVSCLSVEMLPSGYGYILVFEAIGTLVGGPVAGILYDWTNDYPISLYVGGAAILCSGFVMFYPCIFPHTIQNSHYVEKEAKVDEDIFASQELIEKVANTA